jgi:hypothetical protein
MTYRLRVSRCGYSQVGYVPAEDSCETCALRPRAREGAAKREWIATWRRARQKTRGRKQPRDPPSAGSFVWELRRAAAKGGRGI